MLRAIRGDARQASVRLAVGAMVFMGVAGAASTACARAVRPTAASGGAADAAVLNLPKYIGVLDYLGERTRTERRPGHAYSYRAMGLGLDIDVLDYSPAELPDGIDSPRVRRALLRLGAPLRRSGARLVHTATVWLGKPLGRVPLAGRRGLIPAREAVWACASARCQGTTYLWVTARAGRLYEMRFHVAPGFHEDGVVSRSEARSALGQAIEHPLTPTPRPSAQRVDVAIDWHPAPPRATRRLWATYLYTRAAFVAAESGEVALPLGKHTPSFREEYRARLMAVYAYRQLRQANPAFHSAYFAALSRVQAAGFLRAYVWHYLRAPSWRRRPDGLRLARFKRWRAVHLRHHVPETYGSIDIVPFGHRTVAAR